MANNRLTRVESTPYSIFTRREKALIVGIVSVAATFTSIASNMYFPAIPTIAKDLRVTAELVNLTVTSYMIFQGLSPTIWGSVSDTFGRRFTYVCTFVIFLSACVGLAETTHYYQLVILRCLQSTGSASTIAIGAGVLGDITTREERGGYMGVFQAGLLVPLAVGPILGGVFAGTLGWRAIFWFMVIYGGAFLAVMMLFLPETLRSLVGNGSVPAKGLQKPLWAHLFQREKYAEKPEEAEKDLETIAPKKKARLDLLGPLRILFSLQVGLVIIFLSIYYTVWQMTVTAMSTLFARTYDLTEIQIGLTFIANGAGCFLGTLTTGKLLDIDYRRIKSSYTGNTADFPLEKARLRTIWLWSGLQCASSLIFGWTLQQRVHISVPIICTFILGWAATSTQSVISTYLVDAFPSRGASATAALNFSRCLIGAGGTSAVLPLINAINVGWAFTLFTGIMLLGLGLLVVQMTYGGRWRRASEEKARSVESAKSVP